MNTGDPGREIQALRDRITALGTAVLRINASLDVTTVLEEIIGSARALTGARLGAITTTDEAGQVREFVSSGFTAEELDAFIAWPDGPGSGRTSATCRARCA